MPRRAPETLADYLVVAVCPTLIGLLIGSLMWFLVKVFLSGAFVVLWVMSFYVLGIVGVSRIAMEQGSSRASLWGAGRPLERGLGLAAQGRRQLQPVSRRSRHVTRWRTLMGAGGNATR